MALPFHEIWQVVNLFYRFELNKPIYEQTPLPAALSRIEPVEQLSVSPHYLLMCDGVELAIGVSF
jgi:hypothetical protein